MLDKINGGVSFGENALVGNLPRQFTVTTKNTSPFLFLALSESAEDVSSHGVTKNIAGWFSDNNFVALGGVSYRLQYQSYFGMDVDDFSSRLVITSLQSVTSCSV